MVPDVFSEHNDIFFPSICLTKASARTMFSSYPLFTFIVNNLGVYWEAILGFACEYSSSPITFITSESISLSRIPASRSPEERTSIYLYFRLSIKRSCLLKRPFRPRDSRRSKEFCKRNHLPRGKQLGFAFCC